MSTTYNCIVRNGFSVQLGAPNANDPNCTVAGGVAQMGQNPPVTNGYLVPNLNSAGLLTGPPYVVIQGATVALTAAQIQGHYHKLQPADAAAIAFFATIAGTIGIGQANQF